MALGAHRQALIRDLEANPPVDACFVRLRLLDMVRSEHALQFHEQPKDFIDLREVLADIPERAMVLLGAPGSGKTTLLKRLQLDEARDCLAGGGNGVSLFVTLGAYPLAKDPAKDAPPPLEWLQTQWEKHAKGLPRLDALLGDGRVLLLLDALNEMPHRDSEDFRERVDRWRCFLRDDFPPGNRAVFSCRSLDYSETLSVKDDLDVRQVRVQPLTPKQIETFLVALFAPEHAASAWAEIRVSARLLDLYSTPYFLKLLGEQLAYDPRVASESAALFTGYVRRALEREIASPLFQRDVVMTARDREQIVGRHWRNAHDLPTRGPLVPTLQSFAFALQQRFEGGDGNQVTVCVDEALGMLDHPQAENLLAAGEQLCLLHEERRDDQVRFFHQLLQEYFAARQLVLIPSEAARLAACEWRADRVHPVLADKVATLQDFEALPPLDPSGWEETATLAAGMSSAPDAFVDSVAGSNLVLAGRCAALLQAADRVRHETLEALRERLLARSRDPEADLRARIAAGRSLGELGDPRFELRSGAYGKYLLPPLVSIAGCEYAIGSDDGRYEQEEPVHKVTVAGFALGRFPVSNAEWRRFMEAGGYEEARWWAGEAAKRWRRGEDTAEGPKSQRRNLRQTLQANRDLPRQWLEEGRITSEQAQGWEWYRDASDADFEAQLDEWYPGGLLIRPAYWDDPAFNDAAQPVVGICWYEARAYCAWLAAQSGQAFRLPSEVEWEAAARGAAGRRYAWGEEFDAACCNVFETHVRGTTPIGVFPAGDTPEGLADMNGNVWEWTTSLDRRYPYAADDGREDAGAEGPRVVRGGSWYYDRFDCRSACRDDDAPGRRSHNIGFRVCVAPPIVNV